MGGATQPEVPGAGREDLAPLHSLVEIGHDVSGQRREQERVVNDQHQDATARRLLVGEIRIVCADSSRSPVIGAVAQEAPNRIPRLGRER